MVTRRRNESNVHGHKGEKNKQKSVVFFTGAVIELPGIVQLQKKKQVTRDETVYMTRTHDMSLAVL